MPEKELEQYFHQGQFRQAIDYMLAAYNPSLEKIALYDMGLDISHYWLKNIKKIDTNAEPIEIWDDFLNYLTSRYVLIPGQLLESASHFIMQKIYSRYSAYSVTPDDKNSFEKKLGMARSLLWMNKIDALLPYLKRLIKIYPLRSEPWALLGKAYILGKNFKKSLLCFRESFFINPAVLNLMDIKSLIIDEITEFYKATYSKKNELPSPVLLNHWLGICGVVGKFFQVRREFSPEELEELNKRIEVYENKYRIYKKEEDFLNLVRLFVFKIDYFQSLGNEAAVSGDLKKLQTLEPSVYKKIKE